MLQKKTTEYFLEFLFYLIIIENNLIEMAASADHAGSKRWVQFLITFSTFKHSRILSFKASIVCGLSSYYLSLTAAHK